MFADCAIFFRRINIGSHFQAEIPSLRNTFYMLYEEHPAQLVWSPWKDLTTNRKTQKKGSKTQKKTLFTRACGKTHTQNNPKANKSKQKNR